MIILPDVQRHLLCKHTAQECNAKKHNNLPFKGIIIPKASKQLKL